MAKFIYFLTFVLLATIATSHVHAKTHGSAGRPESVPRWFKKLKKAPEPKFKVIEFFVQDIVSGDGQTVFPVAEANITSTSPTAFGRLLVADDRLTFGPDPKTPTLGRGQGIVALSDLVDRVLYMNIVIYFTSGPYKGSTLAVTGRNPLLASVRELAIVGGTGLFRLARGVATTSNHSPYSPTGYTCIKYSLYFTYF